MADTIQLTTHELWVDGRQISISVKKTSPTSLTLSWTLPTNPSAYDGAVILLSEHKFTNINFPIDGTRYTASSNWASPADSINDAHVVAAFYGYFGDDITQKSVEITNVKPDVIYYASAHAASSILQYYTIGSQSYPLESSRFERASETYAGSIPNSIVAPENPSNGQAYFDPSNNIVLVWNDQMGEWVQSAQQTIPIGANPPIAKNQLYFNATDNALKYFDGSVWVTAAPDNLRIKMMGGWQPFSSSSAVGIYPTNPTVGDFVLLTTRAAVSAPPTFEIKFYTVGGWFSPTPGMVQIMAPDMENPPALIWQPIVIGAESFGDADPAIPAVGDFFYQTSTRDLLVWAGGAWIKADTDNEGAPTSDKIGIGTDGSYDERLRLIKVLKHQLGWPGVCVELSEEQFNVAIDNALDTFRQRADNAYVHRHVSFTLKRGQSTYYLNDPRDKTDRIVSVLKIHRVNQLGISSLSSENGLYAQAFFNQLYQGSNIDILSIHLMNQLSETYEKIFAGNLSFTWDEASRQLMVLRRINLADERVVLEVAMERTEQELMYDRYCKQWIQSWAQSECWEMLGESRSKYASLGGPNGGISLNGDSLLSRAEAMQTELLRQITDYEVGNGGVTFGNTTLYIG